MRSIGISNKIHKNFVILFFGITIIYSLCGFAPQARAGSWGEPIFAMLQDNVLDAITTQIQGAILGSLKVAAVQTLNSQISQLAGGSQPVFITDWDKFLNGTPAQQTNLYMSNFFQNTTRGKYSNANYTGFGDISGNVSGSYANYLVTSAENTIYGGQNITYDLDQYTNPNTMFQEGDWRGISAFFKPANNPYGYGIIAQSAYFAELERQKEIARIQAQSSGFLGVQKNGITTTPAGSIQAMVTDVQTLGNKVIASAQSPSQLLSGVVVATVNTMINQVVQRGIGEVQSTIQREIGNVNYEINNSLYQANRALGPGANFTSSLNQLTNVNMNVSTPAPPSARKGL